MQPLRMYLGDLTHDTVGIATELMPLNIGYVASYVKSQLGDQVDIRLFKYVPDLEQAIANEPPDLLGLSNYPWNYHLSMAMLEEMANRRPESLRIMGGPNFPHVHADQEKYLAARPLIDSYSDLYGEGPFKNFVEFVLSVGDLREAREALRRHPIAGCLHVGDDGKLLSGREQVNFSDMDEVPSPFLNGMMDQFFDGKLTPIIQTNRGCPFKCTFCAEGNSLYDKVKSFSLDRVKAEINYIAENIPKNVTTMFISDSNFGMMKRDGEICEELLKVRDKFGYPSHINQSTGKNSKQRIIHNIEKLRGALALSMSVQTLTPSVLDNIKRQNIKISEFLDLAPDVRKAKLPAYSEIILGLPGETKESHVETLRSLLNLGIDHVTPYSLLMVKGSEMETAEQRKMWGFETKFRIIPRDFTMLDSGRTIVEPEEVVIATNTMSFEDYVECRKLALLITIFNNLGFKALMTLMIQNDIKIVDMLIGMLPELDAAANSADDPKGDPAALLMRAYERDTKEELWDSEEEMQAFFEDHDNFQGLIDGRYGANLIQTYSSRALAHCISDFAEYAFRQAYKVFKKAGADEEVVSLLGEVEKFCRARTQNLFGADRMETVPQAEIGYDIRTWMSDVDFRPLPKFKWDEAKTLRFELSEEQYRLVEDGLDRYGHHDLGRGKLLVRLNPDALWRNAVTA